MNEPRLDPNKPDYPTDEQMTAMFNAWKKGGEESLLEALRATHSKAEKKKREPK